MMDKMQAQKDAICWGEITRIILVGSCRRNNPSYRGDAGWALNTCITKFITNAGCTDY